MEQRKLVLFIATSLDGYIARNDDSLDWLYKIEGEGDNGYFTFYENIDTVIMGRKTYDWILKQELEEFPYKNKECYVFSRTPQENNANVTFSNAEPKELIKRLKTEKGKNIWLVGGGELLHAFLNEQLVDELIITVAPTIIGEGIPLFKEGVCESEFTLLGMKQYNQFAELHYKLKKGQ
ncbi:hypothetical protein CIB95_04160 [Lottiidibacillus patelloidae]|uniref:Bacterial bifunctional deaminase-reductase C-terminal domain-containing protein n=1 Tax=Lottiidibacillus patelloidae TaxID=2670334 RepID=A0A263BVJ3_9BACI|nr:dihydrofolate reductase family protein [Lottiidibacillus patelloidae]OZM57572.1 hypothetical protein CIB95_04160 [Lottiidibacillus patelloidae]